MSALDQFSALLTGGSRVVMIAQRDVDLKSLSGENHIFLLKLAEGSLAAGGRGGGFGERRVVMVTHFRYEDGFCEKLFETDDETKVAEFEVPYYVARLPVILRDGTESMGYGVIEPELVAQLMSRAKSASLLK